MAKYYCFLKEASGAGYDEGLELPQNVLDDIRQMHERWNNRPMREKLDIGKEYIQSNRGIVVEFDPAGGGTIGSGTGRKGSGTRTTRTEPRNLTVCAFREKTNPMTHGSPDGGGNDGVFVGIIEEMQSVDFRPVPVFVTRETDQKLFRVNSRCFYSLARGFIIYPLAVGGKRGPSVLCTAIQSDQFPHRMIKSDTQIMDRVADDKRKRRWEVRIDNAGSNYTGCSIMLDSDRILVVPYKAREGGLQIADVMIGPV